MNTKPVVKSLWHPGQDNAQFPALLKNHLRKPCSNLLSSSFDPA